MDETFRRLIFDPTVGRLVAALVGILILVTLVRIAHRALSRHVKDTDRPINRRLDLPSLCGHRTV